MDMKSNINFGSKEINELLKPQLGQSKQPEKGSAKPSDGPGASSDKRIRQAVYDIRYRSRREDVSLDQAFNQYMSNTSMNAIEKDAVKEKLGLKQGGSSSPQVKEEVIDEDIKGHSEKKFKVRVTDKLSGKTYVRYATRKKIDQLRRNKNISSVEMTQYGEPYEGEKTKRSQTSKVSSVKGLDSVGKEDNDGKVNKTDSYLLNRRQKRTQAIQQKKSYGLKEDFYNWRTELFEVVDDEIESQEKKEIKEKKVKNTVKICPNLEETIENIGGTLLFEEDITEEFLSEEVEIATEYFYEQGLNEYGVEIVLEKLGLDEFCNFVIDLSEEYYLTEARRGPGGTKVKIEPKTKTGKSVGSLKGGAKSSAIARLRKEKESRKSSENSSEPSQMTSALKSQREKSRRVAVKTAKVKQPETKSEPQETKKGIGGLIGSALQRAKKDTELLKKSWKTAREVGKGHERRVAKAAGTVAGAVVGAAKVAHRLGQEAGKSETGQKIKKSVQRVVNKEEIELNEKITAKTDMGAAIRDFYDSNSPQLSGRTKKQRRQAAIAAVLTARRNGKKLGEAIDQKITDQPTSADDGVRKTQSDAVKKQQQLQNIRMVQQKQQMLQRQKLQMQKSGKLPLDTAS